jgi:hypothetical protein
MLRHIASHRRKLGVLDLKFVGIANKCANRVPAIQRAVDHFTPGCAGCTKYKHIHRFDSLVD